MNMYCTPTIIQETLNNGIKIPNLFYQMNPLRDPNKRINFYRSEFQSEAPSNRTQTSFYSSYLSKKKKNVSKSVKNNLYNSPYSKLFLRINYERPRQIFNEDGVIISRHFKSLDINSKVFPGPNINYYYLSNKLSASKKYIFNNNIIKNNNFIGSNFFRTEIKNLPDNKLNIPDYGNNIKNNPNFKTINHFNKTFYGKNNHYLDENKLINSENNNINNINNIITSNKFNLEKNYNSREMTPLVNNGKGKNINKIKNI